jgi:hypothetical protein
MSGATVILAQEDIMFMGGNQPKDSLLDLKIRETQSCLN